MSASFSTIFLREPCGQCGHQWRLFSLASMERHGCRVWTTVCSSCRSVLRESTESDIREMVSQLERWSTHLQEDLRLMILRRGVTS